MKNFEHERFNISNEAEVKFLIRVEPRTGVYSIVENPDTELEIIRSPFDSPEEARQRELEIAEYWGFKAIELL